ncbi:MAG TPA: phosphodiester glycosidase family protein [Chthoniobacterales bacterium]|nr:phosphodiester glycosidase family protein [Chthoniobacterales bacterium]
MRKLSRVALLLIFLVAATASAQQWSQISSQSEPSSAKGLEHRYIVVENSANGDRASVELAVFSTKSCRLRVVDQPSEPRRDLEDVMTRGNFLAGVNGGYFDPEYHPIGLLIVDGTMIAPMQKARLLSGVLSAWPKKVQILRVAEFSMSQKPDAAVECGPMIVDLGKSVRGLESTKAARRTFAIAGSGDKAALGFCSDVTLAELSSILTVATIPDLKIQRALNLDGGSSSAFWFKRANGSAFSISEQKTVRDFVAIVPR